jgi:hypothetical protein
MNRITAVARTHLTDPFNWLAMPWLIMSFSFIINLVLGIFFVDEAMYTGGIASIHIYMLVIGIINVTQTFSFAIGFSVRRSDYFLGTAATIVAVSLANAVLLWLMGLIETATDGWGADLHFFHLPYMSDGTAIEQMWFQFAVMLCCFFIGFLFPCVYRRFGRMGLYAFFTAIVAVISIGMFFIGYYEKWGALFEALSGLTAVALAGWAFALALLLALGSYLMLRRSTN